MSNEIRVVAWDFDGVLNRNVVDGRFVWLDDFEDDIGHSREIFDAHMFADGFEPIMSGHEDLHDRVTRWADAVGYASGADALLTYWFEKNVMPDPSMTGLMDRLDENDVQQVIVTNNEVRRASYIENEMGFGARVAHFFTSGRMGVTKPSPEYFIHVTDKLCVAPEEIFYVDDSAANVETALDLGWRALHFTDRSRHELEAILPL